MKIVLDKGAYLPEKAHDYDAGYDLRTPARRGKSRKDGPPARDEPMSGNEFLLSMIREGGDGHADHD